MPSTVFLTRDGKLDEDNAAAFKALVGRLAFAKKNVLLHLHGGLVSQKNGEATASRLAGPAPDGFGLGNDWEQIYVVWRTGTLETLKTNWTDLFDNDRVYDALLNKLLELTAKKVGLPGGTGRAALTAASLSFASCAAGVLYGIYLIVPRFIACVVMMLCLKQPDFAGDAVNGQLRDRRDRSSPAQAQQLSCTGPL